MVFISYSRKDSRQAEHLATVLEDAGVAVWRDVSDIELASYFRSDVTQAIRRCDLLLLLVSHHSIHSREVLSEVELAHEEGKQIVEAYVEPLQEPLPDRLIFMTGKNRIELFKDFDRGAMQLLQHVRSLGSSRDRTEGDLLPYSTFRAMSAQDLQAMVDRLGERIDRGRSDARVQTKIGEYLLQLGRPNEARPHLVTATKMDVSSHAAPYLLALCLIGGRRPRILTMDDVDKVLRLLERAERAEPGLGHVCALSAIVTADYYEGNGLLAPPPAPHDRWARAQSLGVDRLELGRIVDSVGMVADDLAALGFR